MKIAIIGAGGLRTPLILGAINRRAASLGITETALMDTDSTALERMVRLSTLLTRTRAGTGGAEDMAGSAGGTSGAARPVSGAGDPPPAILPTTSLPEALAGADFVITTFRAGGMEGRIRDERIARACGVLGQETTGFGGFAMALRSLPVLENVIAEMGRNCPRAWLVNFANPSGLLAEAAVNFCGWERTVGICDAPAQIHAIAAAVLGIEKERLSAVYFGLNHLGWFSSFAEKTESGTGENLMPVILASLESAGSLPGFPFPGRFLSNLGLIPNEYLSYYYFRETSVERQRGSAMSRGETIRESNRRFLAELDPLLAAGGGAGTAAEAAARYFSYITARQESSMAMNAPDGGSAAASPEASVTAEAAAVENGAFTARFMKAVRAAMSDHEGYPGVALDVIGGLRGLSGAEAIVNVPNGGAISGMDKDDVVEIPVRLGLSAGTAVQGEKAAQDVPTSPAGTPRNLSPVPIGTIPRHCLGLMLQVKEFEKRTIAAAMERSRQGAVTALALHPLIGDLCTAEKLAAALEREAGPLFSPSAGSPGRTAGR